MATERKNDPYRMIGLQEQGEPMSLEQLQQEFGQALAEAGYRTREEIVELVREVKRELAAERLWGAEQDK
jgi:hypothetical protein